MSSSYLRSSSSIGSNSEPSELHGPRIGMYYGILIDQDNLTVKLDPIDIAVIVGVITGISPYDSKAVWKLDYDRSLSYRTIVIYHSQYTNRRTCSGYIGGWQACEIKTIAPDVTETLNRILNAIERLVKARTDTNSFAILNIGYVIAYFGE